MKRELIAIATTVALLTVTSLAATETPESSKVSSRDAAFVREASSDGQAEVEFGRLLTEKAQSAELKDYGKRLMDDHSKANEKLSRIASEKGVQVSTQPTAADRKELQKLENLSGKDFDQSAQKRAIQDHRQDIQKFTDASQNLQDPDLKQFAQETLPVLQDHLRRAQELKIGARQSAER